MLSIILKSLHSTYLFFLPFENRNSAIAIAEKIRMQPKTRFTETFSRFPFIGINMLKSIPNTDSKERRRDAIGDGTYLRQMFCKRNASIVLSKPKYKSEKNTRGFVNAERGNGSILGKKAFCVPS